MHDNNRILIIRPGALGDFIVTIPTIRAIAESCAITETHIMGPHFISPLLADRFPELHLHSIDPPGFHTFFSGKLTPDRKLARFFQEFDVILHYWTDEDGVFSRQLQQCGVRKVIHQPPHPKPNDQRHVSEYLATPLSGLDLPLQNIHPLLKPTVSEQQLAQKFLAEATVSGAFVVCHPGSGSARKNWPASSFARLSQTVIEQTSMSIVFVEGPADEDVCDHLRHALDALSMRDTNRLHWVTQPPLPLVTGLLTHARAYFGNDSGISHLAGAVGCRGVVIFGPTNPVHWRPLGTQVRVLYGSDDLQSPTAEDATRAVIDALNG